MTGSVRVAILADDLIWSDRLARAVRASGAEVQPMRRLAELEAAAVAGTMPGPPAAVIVDLTSRAYDGIEAIGLAAAAGLPVLAVGQHDDHDTRRRATAAGAMRVLAYRKLHADGPAVIAAWLARATAAGAGQP